MVRANLSTDAIEKIRLDIPYLGSATYLDNASISPLTLTTRAAMVAHTDMVLSNPGSAHLLAQPMYDQGRALAAELVGGQRERISFIQNTSHGLSQVALGLDWKRGDNVVLHDMEFPSNYHCWAQLEALGVEIRKVQAQSGRLTADIFRDQIDEATRVVAVSQVQYYSGYRVDIAALGEICSKLNALLVVDGTQSVGALSLDMSAEGVDVICVSAHKWLAGPRGVGFMGMSERAFGQVVPRIIGWRSVTSPFEFSRVLDLAADGRRFESGCENGAGIMGLAARLGQIAECGREAIEERVLSLSEFAVECASHAGLELVHDFGEAERSGITLLRIGDADPKSLLAELKSEGIHVSIRNGFVRISANYYNIECEIERAIETIASLVAR